MVDLHINHLGLLSDDVFIDTDKNEYLADFIAFLLRTTPGSIDIYPELGVGVYDMIGEFWSKEKKKHITLAIKRKLNDLPQIGNRVARITVSRVIEKGDTYLFIGITLITGERYFYTLVMNEHGLRLSKGGRDEVYDEYVEMLAKVEFKDEDFNSIMELL